MKILEIEKGNINFQKKKWSRLNINNIERKEITYQKTTKQNYHHPSLHRGLLTTYKTYWKTCYVSTLQNFTSRILTLSFAELQQAKMGQNAQLCKLPSYVEQTRLCYLYRFLLSNNATTCTYMHGPSLQIARVVLCL